ncbi:hypothetical protein GQ55_2G104300 [Panicum hallii var. hallii]|uniref:Uncharacterized protein n=1 Tax=Panicum hallii var. hallii TaxID=1504633 RepID=A0A2T7ENI7_9POAL|nr:hypothetical protein GQ55_2G104300 [Panicum hallii var. hallii]
MCTILEELMARLVALPLLRSAQESAERYQTPILGIDSTVNRVWSGKPIPRRRRRGKNLLPPRSSSTPHPCRPCTCWLAGRPLARWSRIPAGVRWSSIRDSRTSARPRQVTARLLSCRAHVPLRPPAARPLACLPACRPSRPELGLLATRPRPPAGQASPPSRLPAGRVTPPARSPAEARSEVDTRQPELGWSWIPGGRSWSLTGVPPNRLF